MVSGVQGEESRTQLEEFLHRVDDPGATAGSLVLLRLPTRGNKEFRILLADNLMRIIENQKTCFFIFSGWGLLGSVLEAVGDWVSNFLRLWPFPALLSLVINCWSLGDRLVITWWALGGHLVITWCPIGDNLVITWSSIGNNLAITWTPLADHLVTSWWSLGD